MRRCQLRRCGGKALRVLLALGLLLCAATSATALERVPGEALRVVRVGMTRDYPPYEMVGEDAVPRGFNVDVLRAVAEVAGFEPELRPGLWSHVTDALRAGELDMVIAMLRSDARDEWVDFSTPLLDVEYSIFVRKGTRGISTLEDLRGRPVLVEGGGLMHEYLRELGMGEQAVPVASEPEALRILDQGQFSAALAPYRQGLEIAAQFGLERVEPAGPPIRSTGLCFAVREGDTALLELLDQGLAGLRESGRFQQLYNAHFGVARRAAPERAAWQRRWPALAAGVAAAALALGAGRLIRRRRTARAEGGAQRLGSYELIEKIGSGGMGEVWRARHLGLSRSAAIKLIRVDQLQGDAESAAHALVRFEREARATAALRSPHTVELYDYGRTPDGSVYYAMELLRGLDLQSLVERFGPLPPERAVHLLLQVCQSLEEAHQEGILHRDIKPANIFACRMGTAYDVAKVLDFGLVKLREGSGEGSVALTKTHVVTGTPLCLAPEAVTSEAEIGPRSDLYSVGCVAYWLLTGHPVFEAENPVAMAVAHATEAPKSPSLQSPSPLPPELEALVLACLAKDPEARPASAAALAKQLSACSSPTPWSSERAAEWWRTNMPEVAAAAHDSASSILLDSR